jgi:hypothetical protein
MVSSHLFDAAVPPVMVRVLRFFLDRPPMYRVALPKIERVSVDTLLVYEAVVRIGRRFVELDLFDSD